MLQVLDVGSGSGYLTIIFAYLVQAAGGQPSGKVVGVDIIQDLVQRSTKAASQIAFAGPMLSRGDLVFRTVCNSCLSALLAAFKGLACRGGLQVVNDKGRVKIAAKAGSCSMLQVGSLSVT